MSNSSSFSPTEPVLLEPVAIAKPWGREIWYSAIEARGISKVRLGEDLIDLDKYLALDPAALTCHQPVLLLKILDPKPEPVGGDLYFEVHEHKQEVYIVTALDPHAWPDGHGGIRFGMDQQRRAQYGSDTLFRQAYLDAVLAYEKVRRRIDAAASTGSPKRLETVKDAARETQLRQVMDAFTHLRPLQVGEVVQVPPWTPHALQHGVRVVEFQTATYERHIISFAQKVITQDHWDSALAVAKMHVAAPEGEVFESLAPGIDRVARFADFNVWRINFAATTTSSVHLPNHIPYAIAMAVHPGVQINNLLLAAEQACFIPGAALQSNKPTISAQQGHLLIAAPNL